MIYIIVLNWNGVEDTLNCLTSLTKMKHKDYAIIVCDNGSTDDSIKKIIHWGESLIERCNDEFNFIYSKIKKAEEVHLNLQKKNIVLFDIGKNLGYAAGNNIGLNYAIKQDNCEAVWILNNDTEVDENALSEIIKYRHIKGDGIYGSKLVYFHDKKTIQGLGGLVNKYLCTTSHYMEGENIDIKIDNEKISDNIDYIIGASFFITNKVLRDVGEFSEDYFLYFEEIDYCIRAKNKGYNIFPVSGSVVYHKEGASTKKDSKGILSDYLSIKNRLLVSKKFYRKYFYIVYLSLIGVLLNRLIRHEMIKAKNIALLIFGKDVYPIDKLMK